MTSSPPKKRSWGGRMGDLVLVLIALALVVYLFRQQDSGPPAGQQALPFDLPLVGVEGRFSHGGPRQRPLLVEVFASWCGACKRSSPILEGLRDASDAGTLDILLVSVDDGADQALAAKRSWPISLPVAFDERGAFQRAYGIKVLPTYVLIGTDGTVQRVNSGPPSAATIRSWLHARER